jgi:hypothetical protein
MTLPRSVQSSIYESSALIGDAQQSGPHEPTKQFIENISVEPDGMTKLPTIHP